MLQSQFENKPIALSRLLTEHLAQSGSTFMRSIERQPIYLSLAPGEILFNEGEAGGELYFVLSGRLQASVAEVAGSRTLGTIGRGETIGELALFTGEPRSATVVALRQAKLVKLTRQSVDKIIAKRPELAVGLTNLVIERHRRGDRQGVNIVAPRVTCMLPISPAVDAERLARALQARQSGTVAIVSGQDDLSGRRLEELEQEHDAVYLVARYQDCAWTRFCVENADEILLIGDADADPALGDFEERLASGRHRIMARQTLVLLQRSSTRTPRHTARWLALRKRPRHFHIRDDHPKDLGRLARIISGRASGLVLAGGGARGLAHLGVHKALEEAGIEVDFVGGSSIGGLMATLLALDLDSAEILSTVREAFLASRKSLTGDFSLLPLLSLIKGERGRDALRRTIRAHTGAAIDIEDTWKPMFLMASNFSTASEEVLTSASLEDGVAASYAIPGVLPPVVRDGQLLFDGSIFNNFPVQVMKGLGVGSVIGVDLSDDAARIIDVPHVPGTFALMRDRLRPRALQRYRAIPTLPETMILSSFITAQSRQRSEREHVDLLFHPALPEVGMLDWSRFDEVVELGYRHASERLAETSGAFKTTSELLNEPKLRKRNND